MAKIQARKDWVLCANPRDEEEVRASGIIISKKLDKQDAYVIQCSVVSSGVEDIAEGDDVLLNYWDASPTEITTGRYLAIQGKLVMAKVIHT